MNCMDCHRKLDDAHSFSGYGFWVAFCADCCPGEYDGTTCEKHTDPLDEALARRPDTPKVGSEWIHSKSGNAYYVAALALIESNLQWVAVYKQHGDGPIWVRPVSEWLDEVHLDNGRSVPRFIEADKRKD